MSMPNLILPVSALAAYGVYRMAWNEGTAWDGKGTKVTHSWSYIMYMFPCTIMHLT